MRLSEMTEDEYDRLWHPNKFSQYFRDKSNEIRNLGYEVIQFIKDASKDDHENWFILRLHGLLRFDAMFHPHYFLTNRILYELENCIPIIKRKPKCESRDNILSKIIETIIIYDNPNI